MTLEKRTANRRQKWEAVNSTRSELVEIQPRYDLIRHSIYGEYAIKEQRTTYLPQPNPTDTSDTNQQRYEDYLCRAVFYNVTQRTQEGLVGQIFLRPPIPEFPSELEPLIENADQEGNTLAQVCKKASGYVLAYGRAGLLADFPNMSRPASKSEVLEGTFRPVIRLYKPWDIINWQVEIVNSESVLTMVVLKEYYEKRDTNGFEVTLYEQYRVIELINGKVVVTLVKLGENGSDPSTEQYRLRDSDGVPLDRIPFVFMGSENNDTTIDRPPLYDMAVLNVSHYRNSADYEESVFYIGQPTLFISGVNQAWVNDVWKGKVQMGARAGIPAPQGASADILQVEPNTLAKEAMEQKEQQMIAIGAKLVERKSNVERKEAEIQIEAASDVSVLTKIAYNIEDAFKLVLSYCGKFVGADTEELKYEVNKNFDLTSLTAEELRQLNELINSENPLLAFEEIRKILERSGYTCLDLEEAKAAIEEDQQKKVAMAKMMMEATTPPQPPSGANNGTGGNNSNS